MKGDAMDFSASAPCICCPDMPSALQTSPHCLVLPQRGAGSLQLPTLTLKERLHPNTHSCLQVAVPSRDSERRVQQLLSATQHYNQTYTP